ncbi:MAG: hypothetical protein LBP75_02165 [Planctomycetota bacterium]|nr:hypothetical protein [Planctomycetota bacterium]
MSTAVGFNTGFSSNLWGGFSPLANGGVAIRGDEKSAGIAGKISAGGDSVEISAAAYAAFANFSATAGAISAVDLSTKEGRAEQAKNYDALLAGLRDEYDEPEAMRRFDEIMRADGYELRIERGISGGINACDVEYIGGINFASGSAQFTESQIPQISAALSPTKPATNMSAYSSITAAEINGREEYWAETSVAYNVTASAKMSETFAAWRDRPVADDLQAQINFDLSEYMDKFRATGDASTLDSAAGVISNRMNNGQIAAVGVSADLATVAKTVLEKAGVTLAAGENLMFSFVEDGAGKGNFRLHALITSTDGNRFSAEIDDVLKNDADIFQAFQAKSDRIAFADLSEIGSYSDGPRFVSYGQSRKFIFSADEPSTLVIGDQLSVDSEGYTYQKKISDRFITTADYFSISASRSLDESFAGGKFIPNLSQTSREDELARRIIDATKSGGVVNATISEQDWYDWNLKEATEYASTHSREFQDYASYAEASGLSKEAENKVQGEKKTANKLMASVDQTPTDYRELYGEIKNMWLAEWKKSVSSEMLLNIPLASQREFYQISYLSAIENAQIRAQ